MYLKDGTLLQGGKYRIVRFINSGGFGCTYEAEHAMLGTRVAVKEFFVKDFCNRDENRSHVTVGTHGKKELVDKLRKKFVEEARAVFAMRHPGIVRVIDIFEENGTAYYVMNYIEGKSLAGLVAERGALPEDEALKYIRQVADALDYVHGLNRLHLDIKPGNIMLDAKGNAILIDFGASKHYNSDTGENTSTLMGVNTPGYAPAEQVAANFTRFNPAADIYALGATLYKLLTGVTPPDSVSLMTEASALEPLPSEISDSTRSAVMAAMQPKAKDRPQTIAEFLDLLDGYGRWSKKREVILYDPSFDYDSTIIDAPKNEKEQKPDLKKSSLRSFSLRRVVGYIFLGILLLFVVSFLSYYNTKGSQDELLMSEDTLAVEDPLEIVLDCDTIVGQKNHINGHEFVDLGLSVKWATCNIGADSPTEYGDYLQWGEIYEPEDGNYSESSCRLYGESVGDICGDPRYDAAHVRWGESWRLPTLDEFIELTDNCNLNQITRNGVRGYEVKSKSNGNSIFLPAAGCRNWSSPNRVGTFGIYWTSTPEGYELSSRPSSINSYGFYILSDNEGVYTYSSNDSRCYRGHSVRPVTE